jgi:hypothetical protein
MTVALQGRPAGPLQSAARDKNDAHWCDEGHRLLREYQRTGDPRHLRALGTHIAAMFVHANKASNSASIAA